GDHASFGHDYDLALQVRASGDRLPVYGEWPFLRRHRRRLRHAYGGRARRGARRAGGGADPRRFHFRDSRALRHARHAAPREARGAPMPIELLALLLSPLAGSAVLALVGHRPRAAEVNAVFSILGFAAVAVLVARVIESGALVAPGVKPLVDSLNVFPVALTA